MKWVAADYWYVLPPRRRQRWVGARAAPGSMSQTAASRLRSGGTDLTAPACSPCNAHDTAVRPGLHRLRSSPTCSQRLLDPPYPSDRRRPPRQAGRTPAPRKRSRQRMCDYDSGTLGSVKMGAKRTNIRRKKNTTKFPFLCLSRWNTRLLSCNAEISAIALVVIEVLRQAKRELAIAS